jgi:hypothetical protein
MYALFSPQLKVDKIKEVVSDPFDDHYSHVSQFTELDTVLKKLIDNACTSIKVRGNSSRTRVSAPASVPMAWVFGYKCTWVHLVTWVRAYLGKFWYLWVHGYLGTFWYMGTWVDGYIGCMGTWVLLGA